MYQSSSSSQFPDVTKNLLIINGLLFFGTLILDSEILDLNKWLALYPFQSLNFKPYQLITHMFMHATFNFKTGEIIFSHILMNMFALWMFGRVLENVWGGKRFLVYYLITGLGAALLHLGVNQIQIYQISTAYPELLDIAKQGMFIKDNDASKKLSELINTPMVGASGAVYGLLLAYGMLFPNSVLYLYFAIPVKAKYFVIGIGVLALILGFGSQGSNIAHFAHLGGMIFGFLLLKYWQKDRNTFY